MWANVCLPASIYTPHKQNIFSHLLTVIAIKQVTECGTQKALNKYMLIWLHTFCWDPHITTLFTCMHDQMLIKKIELQFTVYLLYASYYVLYIY